MSEPPERLAGLHGIAGRVSDPAGHDEDVAGVLVEQFVRLDVQRAALNVPDDLIDADLLSGRRPAGKGAA